MFIMSHFKPDSFMVWGHCVTNAVNCVNSSANGIQLLCPSGGNFRSPQANDYFRCPRLRYLPCRCKCNGTIEQDDVVDTCRLMTTISSQLTGDDYLSLRVAITRIFSSAVRPTPWPNRIRREAGMSNLSEPFRDHSSEYPTRNSTHSNDNRTLYVTDYSNNNGTHNSTGNSKDYYSLYSAHYSTNAISRATQVLVNQKLSSRYGEVIDYLTKSIDVENHVNSADVVDREVATTEIEALTHSDVMTQGDASALNSTITRSNILTPNDELLGSNKTSLTTENDKDQTKLFVTLITTDAMTGGMSVSQGQGMTKNALTDHDRTPSDHAMTTSDNRVTRISHAESLSGTGLIRDVMSNVTVDATTNFTQSSDSVSAASELVSDATTKSVLAAIRMNPLVNNNSSVNVTMVTDSMVTHSLATDYVLSNATVRSIDAEPVSEKYTVTAVGLDSATSDAMATSAIATSGGIVDEEDELVIYYDDSPISGATVAFLAMVLVLILMVIVLNCYGPRWGHVYRWRYGCRQTPAGPRTITTGDNQLCPMTHLAKVSDLPVLIEQRAY